MAGCGPAGAWAAWIVALSLGLGASAIGLSGCSESHEPDPPGTMERCCESGMLATCLCPAGAICNFGLGLVDCGDGTCTYGSGPEACGGGDAGVDAGGSWDVCCESGRLSTCYCPADTACNYGLGLVDCGDGTCHYGSPDACGADAGVDAGPADGGAGDWEPCCEDGLITTCFCPAASECNYGLFTDCGGGTCGFGACPDAGMSAGAP